MDNSEENSRSFSCNLSVLIRTDQKALDIYKRLWQQVFITCM